MVDHQIVAGPKTHFERSPRRIFAEKNGIPRKPDHYYIVFI